MGRVKCAARTGPWAILSPPLPRNLKIGAARKQTKQAPRKQGSMEANNGCTSLSGCDAYPLQKLTHADHSVKRIPIPEPPQDPLPPSRRRVFCTNANIRERTLASKDAVSSAYHRHLIKRPGNWDRHTRRQWGLCLSTHLHHSSDKGSPKRDTVHESCSKQMEPLPSIPTRPSPHETTMIFPLQANTIYQGQQNSPRVVLPTSG